MGLGSGRLRRGILIGIFPQIARRLRRAALIEMLGGSIRVGGEHRSVARVCVLCAVQAFGVVGIVRVDKSNGLIVESLFGDVRKLLHVAAAVAFVNRHAVHEHVFKPF